MKPLHDLNGDGRDEVVVSEAGALGILGFQSGALHMEVVSTAGSRIGSWTVAPASDAYSLAGDVDGDGTAEVLVTGTGGVGFLKFGPHGVSCPYLAKNGTAWGQWRIDTTNNEFGPLADMNADGRAELLVTSPWGLAVLAPATTGFLTPICAENGTRFGDWTIDTTDDAFGPAADFDGDKRALIVMANAQGLRLLRLGVNTLDTVASLQNGASVSGWSFDATAIRIIGAADIDGDGKAELILLWPTALFVLKLENGGLGCVASTALGNRIDGWRLGGQDRWGPIADYNGDGKAEILVSSGWGIGLVSMKGGTLATDFVVANGTALGHWRLDTARDRLNRAVDLDGDGKAELLVSSPWGIGLLDLSGAQPISKAAVANGTPIGAWTVQTGSNDFEQGRGRGLILYDAHDIPGTVKALQARGYVVIASDQQALLQRAIRRLSISLGIGDRLFVHFWTDGGQTSRAYGETDKAPCGQHYLETDDGGLTLGDFSPFLSRAAWSGVDITVIDSSCHGGETVLNALGERYCAMSMTGVFEVAQLHTPDPGGVISSAGRPGVFGAWYAGKRDAFSLLNGTLLRNNIIDRIQQRLYRNDNVATTAITMLGRDGLRGTDCAAPWFVTHMGQCYLSKYVDPSNYTSACTNSAQSFIAWVTGIVDPQLPAIEGYKSHVFDHPQSAAAGSLYFSSFAIVWQTLAGDPSWNPAKDPHKYSSSLGGNDPSRYNSASGFATLISDARALLATAEAAYANELTLLQSIDAAVHAAAQQKKLVMPTLAEKPISSVASLDRALLQRMSHDAGSRRAPADTGVTEIDALVTQYQQSCSDYSAACHKVTFLLAIIEDSLIAIESAGQVNPGDYVFF